MPSSLDSVLFQRVLWMLYMNVYNIGLGQDGSGEGGQKWVVWARMLPAGGVLETLVALNYGDPKERGWHAKNSLTYLRFKSQPVWSFKKEVILHFEMGKIIGWAPEIGRIWRQPPCGFASHLIVIANHPRRDGCRAKSSSLGPLTFHEFQNTTNWTLPPLAYTVWEECISPTCQFLWQT